MLSHSRARGRTSSQSGSSKVGKRLTPTERSLRARIGAYSLHSKRDPRETTAAARLAFLKSFERQVDPDGILSAVERRRRAESAKKAHFARMGLKSAKARRGKKKPV